MFEIELLSLVPTPDFMCKASAAKNVTRNSLLTSHSVTDADVLRKSYSVYWSTAALRASMLSLTLPSAKVGILGSSSRASPGKTDRLSASVYPLGLPDRE